VSRLVHRIQVLLALGCLAYAAQAVFTVCGTGATDLFENVVYPGLIATAGVLCALRAATARSERAPWAIIAAGLLLWAAGEAYATAVLVDAVDPPLPSPADALWIAFYPAAYVAVVLLARRRLDGNTRILWLDGAIGVGAVSALGAALTLSPLLAGLDSAPRVVTVDLVYLLGDTLLIAFVTMLLALTGWTPKATWTLIVSALAMIALSDGLSVFEGATGASLGGTAFAAFAPLGAVLLSVAAWRGEAPVGAVRLTGWRLLAMPAGFALIALGVVVAATFTAVNVVATLIAVVTLLAVIGRMTWTYASSLQVLARSRHEALTDALTELGNRRLLLGDLERVCADGGTPRTLLLFDLDGFKGYNDTFGHPAGDALLARLGGALRDAVGEHGTTYRLGGDEFCAIVDATGGRAETLRAQAAVALSEHGSGFMVTASCGSVEVPVEAWDSTRALKIADERLYAQKASRRTEATHVVARDVLLQAIRECEPDLESHSAEVAGTAARIAARMGMADHQIRDVERAAELHDVGKVAVPDAILNKPGALDDADWRYMRQHTLIGQRILAVAPALHPIADLVRASHERFDGTGYPDRLAGAAIPLGARIIAVCDAYDAMTSDRPYREASSHAQALEELARCAGTHFDPRVVEAFCETVEPASPSGPPRGALAAA
jgi:two-component system, cell cycle response regulator